MVRFDTSDKQKMILLGKSKPPGIYRYNPGLQLMDSLVTKGPIVDVQLVRGTMIVCNIGNLYPNDAKLGSIEKFNFSDFNKRRRGEVLLFDKLARPVQVVASDLNQDKKMDYLVCGFGNLLGSLSWFENKGNGKFTQHILRSTPGAIKVYIGDYNHDGLPDIWALFAQGDECIMLFTNKGNGNFEGKKILQFPAIYGSTYFELDDFNKDGFPDILYTCGDNADYSPVLKPYHGIYIFMNDGTNHFNQSYFFPMYGCMKAMARDFDGDGDLDIAAISFFADNSHHPEEGFFYLENIGKFQFQPYTLKETTVGRWLTMDVGDFYRLGRPDIVLGNFNSGSHIFINAARKTPSPSFMVLRNTIK